MKKIKTMGCESCNINVKLVEKLIVIDGHNFCKKCLRNIMTPENFKVKYISHLGKMVFVSPGEGVVKSYYLDELKIGSKEFKEAI